MITPFIVCTLTCGTDWCVLCCGEYYILKLACMHIFNAHICMILLDIVRKRPVIEHSHYSHNASIMLLSSIPAQRGFASVHSPKRMSTREPSLIENDAYDAKIGTIHNGRKELSCNSWCVWLIWKITIKAFLVGSKSHCYGELAYLVWRINVSVN